MDYGLDPSWLEEIELEIAKTVIALIRYVRHAVLSSEAACSGVLNMNLFRASRSVETIVSAVPDLNQQAVTSRLNGIQSAVIALEACLRNAGAYISERHDLAQLFRRRDNLRAMA